MQTFFDGKKYSFSLILFKNLVFLNDKVFFKVLAEIMKILNILVHNITTSYQHFQKFLKNDRFVMFLDNDRTNVVYGPAITNVPVSLPVPMPGL